MFARIKVYHENSLMQSTLRFLLLEGLRCTHLNSKRKKIMQRRDFLKYLAGGVALTGISAVVGVNFMGNKSLAANNAPGPLPIPAMLEGEMKDGVRHYDLNMQRGTHEFFKGYKTPTFGINASFLGSTLKLRNGEKIRLNVTNNIGEVTTLHWHGIHLPAKADGGPHQTVAPGKTWSPSFTVKQKASTFWYHSHTHKKTGEQVWRGLAGMLIVEDEASKTLSLPNTYGVDDIPVILQERAFNRDGTFIYLNSMHDRMMGMKGNIPITNGAITPYFEAKTKKVRLRILNGSNASFYNLGFSDNRPFQQIGSDGGLLESPVEMTRVYLGPAERAEIVVDISDGKEIFLISDGVTPESSDSGMGGGMGRGMMGRGMMGGMMGGSVSKFAFMQIRPSKTLKASRDVPTRLATIDRLDPRNAVKTRRFEFNMRMGPGMMMSQITGIGSPFAINGRAMDMKYINEVIKLGDTEIWEITNPSPLPHPFHVHDVQFQILDRNGNKPHAGESGLKDTVIVNSGETVRIIAKFEDYADPETPFMYHCHILEHEDAGMMGQFTVVA